MVNDSADSNQIPLPANDTKELIELHYPIKRLGCTFNLTQVAGDGSTTGSSLWLSSQILVCFLQQKYDRRLLDKEKSQNRVIELGAGIGLTSLVLERLGWKVIATDIAPPLHTVLRPNINQNSQGNVKVCSLNWTTIDDDMVEKDEFEVDLIITADTIYQPTLVDGLFKTIQILLKKALDKHSSYSQKRRPHALIALERRDDEQIKSALNCATEQYNLILKQISPREVRKAVDACFGNTSRWPRHVWDDVEIWRADYFNPVPDFKPV
jgi:protein N-lysine methyltransferase METTL21D